MRLKCKFRTRSCGDVGGPHCDTRDDCRQRGGEGRGGEEREGRAGEGRGGKIPLFSTTIYSPCTFMNIHHDDAIVLHNNYHYLSVRVLREAVKMSSAFL